MTQLKTLKNLSFTKRRAGHTEVSGSKSKTVREASAPKQEKNGVISKLIAKLPSHSFHNDKFDDVTTRTRHQKDDGRGNSEFVGTHVGTRGSSSVEFGKSALTGHYTREAVAGAHLSKTGAVTGKHGSAAYQAELKAEAAARFDANGRLDKNGLVATAGGKANVSVEANVHGVAKTKPVTILGVTTDAGIEATARAVAELNAEASAKAQITRHPPTAILEGKAGASAVAKIEGDIEAHVGPFSVRGAAYGSAGAEATASGIVGYQDGKFTLGGSAGAAFGLGAGGNATVQVDVAMIGQAAKNAADRNHDGKISISDAGAGAKQAASKVTSAAANKVKKTASKWKDRLLG